MTDSNDAIQWDTPPTGLDTVAADLRALREQAGSPSFNDIRMRIAVMRAARRVPEHEQKLPRSTIYDCFRDSRRRIDVDLVTEVATALGLPRERRTDWSRRVAAAREVSLGASIAVARDNAPSPVDQFTGRERELTRIADALNAKRGMAWISGMGGIGKTQLVLEAARRHASPTLFLDLRGFHAESPPVDAHAAQRAILRGLGVDERLPISKRERIRLVRKALRDGDALLVLDDARDPAHVAEIVGADAIASVIVTSRSTPGRDDSRWSHVPLHGLTTDEVAAVLGPYLGDQGTDSQALATLTSTSGGSPLAIALIGGRLKSHPEWTLAEHVELMSERIAHAHIDDELRTSLALSYASLPPDAARLLRLSADLPVAEFDVDDAAAVLDLPTDRAAVAVAELIGGSLAIARRENSFALHSLVRAFARERAREIDSPRARNGAFGRIGLRAAQMVWAAYAAVVGDFNDTPRLTTFQYPRLEWTRDDADAWLHRTLSSTLALAYAAPERGHPELLFRLSEGLSWWMNFVGLHADALPLHETAVDTAAQMEDADALAMASLDAGQLLIHSDRLDEALSHFERATRLVADAGDLTDPGLEGVLLNMTALIHVRRGVPETAATKLRRAIAIHRDRNEVSRLLGATVNLGVALHTLGRFDEEAAVVNDGLSEAESNEQGMFAALFLSNQASLSLAIGELDAALENAELAVKRGEQVGAPFVMVHGHGHAGMALLLRGDPRAAQLRIDESLELARSIGAELTIAEMLLYSAEIALALNDFDRATTELAEAESLLAADGDPRLRGELARLRSHLPGEDRRRHLEQALAHYEAAGSYEADAIRSELAEL